MATKTNNRRRRRKSNDAMVVLTFRVDRDFYKSVDAYTREHGLEIGELMRPFLYSHKDKLLAKVEG